jgi:hypothetical protein
MQRSEEIPKIIKSKDESVRFQLFINLRLFVQKSSLNEVDKIFQNFGLEFWETNSVLDRLSHFAGKHSEK